MTGRFGYFWWRLRSSYWFVPSVMAAGAVALSLSLVQVDAATEQSAMKQLSWVYEGGAEGARTVLSALAGSVITVAGVTFSITIAALTLASQQFGPRLLRNFMRDLPSQLTLGTFTSTEIYCLLVLRTVRGGETGVFVPQLSVTVGVGLGVACLGMLVYFIHHIALSMQAPHIIAAVARDLSTAIDEMFPDRIGRNGPAPEDEPPGLPGDFESGGVDVCAPRSGYVQLIDHDTLMDAAREHDLLIRLARRPGHWVVEGMPLAHVHPRGRPADGAADEALVRRLAGAFVLGSERTPTQDTEFSVHQLVEVAARALSPGIHDPFTAMTCVDQLAAGLCRLAGRRIPSRYRRDADGRLRVIADPFTFPGVVEAAFDQIRQYGRGNAAVTIRLLEAIGSVLRCTSDDEHRAALMHQADAIRRQAVLALPDESDQADVEARYLEVAELAAGPRGAGRVRGETCPEPNGGEGGNGAAKNPAPRTPAV